MGADRLQAEQRARVLIDQQLTAAGWHVCDQAQLNLIHHPNCALREVIMKSGAGRADYLLLVGRRIVGVIEAKPEGTTLTGVEWQSAMYAEGLRREQNTGYDDGQRSPGVRVRGVGYGDALHRWLRPEPPRPQDLFIPSS